MNEQNKKALNDLLGLVLSWLRFMWPMLFMLAFMALYGLIKAVLP